jgi:NMD protein affecting ribosome stability and mRNA decay
LAKITQTFKDKGVDERGRKKSTSTVCIRFPSFKEGDLVQLKNGELLQFLAFEREKATFSDLKNRNIKKISAKNLWKNDPKLFLKIEDVPEFMVISIGTKIVQLMSLKTYELAEISKENVPKAIKEGETIPCLQDPQTGELRLLLKQENPEE